MASGPVYRRVVVDLRDTDRAMLSGEAGPGVRLAMRIVVGLADATSAPGLIDITRAHIDGCLYHGQAGLDFAVALADGGARVAVPTTLNVSSLDLLHPDLYRGPDDERVAARALMDAYVAMGCSPTWTCAPYQLPERPRFGEQIVWAESNAIVFANSVIGARTARYGDFIDIAAAITGRAPDIGLHRDENRIATMVVDARPVAHLADDSDIFFALLGHLLGVHCATDVPAIVGIDAATEDQLKAMGAAAASSGAVGMFHLIGITPEAPDLATATGGKQTRTLTLSPEMLDGARRQLTTAPGGAMLASVNVGTPHYSADQIRRLAAQFAGRRVADGVAMYVNTNRAALDEVPGDVEALETLGARFVVDTCTYITPILEPSSGVAMTDSAKWAYYAPANIGVDVVFGGMRDCVESAVAGRVVLA